MARRVVRPQRPSGGGSDGRRRRRTPRSVVRLVGRGRAQRQPAEARLEPRGVRGREDRRLPDVVPQPQVAAQRRDRQRSVAPAQVGRLQSPAAEDRQVSALNAPKASRAEKKKK